MVSTLGVPLNKRGTSQGFQKRSDQSGIDFKGTILVALWRMDKVQGEDGGGVRRERQNIRV